MLCVCGVSWTPAHTDYMRKYLHKHFAKMPFRPHHGVVWCCEWHQKTLTVCVRIYRSWNPVALGRAHALDPIGRAMFLRTIHCRAIWWIQSRRQWKWPSILIWHDAVVLGHVYMGKERKGKWMKCSSMDFRCFALEMEWNRWMGKHVVELKMCLFGESEIRLNSQVDWMPCRI